MDKYPLYRNTEYTGKRLTSDLPDKRTFILLFLLTIFSSSPEAYAHSQNAAGFFSGFTHPIYGLDHLLAMLGVGVISARIAGHYIWTIPSLFVISMIIGGAVGAGNILIPFVETGIALSVLLLGLAILLVEKTIVSSQKLFVMLFVAFFGFLHGHAHGMEMPSSLSPLFYSIGFALSTSMIHIVGVLIGHLPNKFPSLQALPSYSGGAMIMAGVAILLGIL